MIDFDCPYCGNGSDYYDDPLSDGESTEVQCGECEKNFIVTAYYSVDHISKKADCLNGGEHKWNKQRCVPEYFANIICDECGSTHNPSDEERENFGIPIIPEVYLKKSN